MKKLKSAFYLFAAALMTFSACSDDEDPCPIMETTITGRLKLRAIILISL